MQTPWWRRAVIYQIYPRSFMDSDGDGVGDLAGITMRLEYLADTLGVEAIWISPFYPSPMDDFGYDVSDYCDVDPLFGTLDDWDRLVEKAHGLGLRVIVDWVPNHTSMEHPWFVASRSSREHPKRDWFVWRDPQGDGSEPNNWLSVFGGPAWAYDELTGQYYLHSFLASQPDLNWRNAEVKEAMFDTLRFWLDRGVDGFRMDVVHFIMKDPQLRSNPVLAEPAPGPKPLGPYDLQDHVYDNGHPDIHEVFREIRALLDGYDGDRFSVGEIHEFDWQRWASFYGDDDELHMPFNFTMIYGDWTADWARSIVEAQEATIPPGAWPNHVLGNHDEPRIATRLGARRARLATMMLLTLRGTPTLYYGDELGMVEVPVPADLQQDPWGHQQPGYSRDGCRTPMQWTAAPGGGFTDGAPWLPLHDPDGTLNVEAQLGDAGSMLELTRRLLRLRRHSEALTLGEYDTIADQPEGVFAYRRARGTEQCVIVLNFADTPVEVELDGEVVDATSAAVGRSSAGRLRLGGLDGAMLRP